MTIRHQVQPTTMSCGPTCVAMLAGVPVATVLADLPHVRWTARRLQLRTGATNVGELRRLLRPHGWRLGRRTPHLPAAGATAILRLPNGTRTGWHWVLWHNGLVHDPSRGGPVAVIAIQGWLGWMHGVSHYPLQTLTVEWA